MTASRKENKEGALLTPSQVAKMLHVSPVTVRHWSINAKLEYITTLGGHRRYRLKDIEKYITESKKRKINSRSTILIVDDDKQHTRFLTDYFIEFFPQIKTIIAHDGFMAADLLHRVKPDLIMLDLMMPGMDGFEVCSHIKQDTEINSLPVIAMTGYPSKENIMRIMQAGAVTCFSKPIDRDALYSLVIKLIDINHIALTTDNNQ